MKKNKTVKFDEEKLKTLVKEGRKIKEIAKMMNMGYEKTRYQIEKIVIFSEEEKRIIDNLFNGGKTINLKLKRCEDLEFFKKFEIQGILKITMLEQDCCYTLEMIN